MTATSMNKASMSEIAENTAFAIDGDGTVGFLL